MFSPQGPLIVFAPGTKRDQGRRSQLANIEAGRSVAGIVRTTLGPKSMLKMLLDPLGGITITNDGNAILREIDVTHPAAKSLIELSRAQDEEVGDGTTSVVIVAGEILAETEQFLSQKIHPTLLVQGYFMALEDSMAILESMCISLDLNDNAKLTEVVAASLATKFSSEWGGIVTKIALKAAKTVLEELEEGRRSVDIKRYVRVEKIPGGLASDCVVIPGVVINKDVTHAKMRRIIHNPRILLLDCPLEYKKGESMTNVEITKEDDFEKLLVQEEEEVQKMCDEIAAIGCDLVITEKGVSDLAAHFLIKKNISVIRRAKKTDTNRIAKVSGATIVNRTSEITANDVGTLCKLFRVDKIDDDYWAYLTDCEDPKACTIMLRGGSKDSLNEIERNLQDALNVAKNILLNGKLLPGGGATEIQLAMRLKEKSGEIKGLQQWGYRAVGKALEVIPRTLIENCGGDVVRTMARMRALHSSEKNSVMGVNGNTGEIVNTEEHGIWDTYAVKSQILKTAIECAAMLMRVDDILSGIGKKKDMVPEITNYGGENPE